MSDAQAKAFPFNPFDLTKIWPKAQFPLIEVGFFELNRNPENFFAEVEQAAFSPANIVPGIGFSPDKMLQARLFSYGDTQRYRLGVNFNHIPVNAPKCPFHSYHRDGAMRTDGNLGRTPTYFPNSRGEWIDQPQLNEPPLAIDGAAAHWDHRVDDDHYQQPGDLFRKMNAAQRQALFDNTARQIGGVSQPHPGAPHRQLHQSRSGLRRGRCAGDCPACSEGLRGRSKNRLRSLERTLAQAMSDRRGFAAEQERREQQNCRKQLNCPNSNRRLFCARSLRFARCPAEVTYP